MDKELLKLIDAALEPLQQFHFERKRIMANILTENNDDWLDDPFANSGLEGVYRELQRRELLRRGQESWMMRHLIDRLSQLGGEEDFPLPKSETDGAETKAGSVTGQFQQTHDSQQL
jgi:hypothetical protein